ncbi:olfactory receptor 1E16-like [Cololabis saira]|uniref:olfactory receptor 1E16-like n=1 Tax=Cololabis saira TaxID=129043 RepID=UPI002AD265FF|nr:olfactory receptor 1E16-like [Cololabis saira]
MDLFNSALGRNITFVRPPYFIIRGFIGTPNIKYYYVFLFFVYVFSVLGNSAVMAVIYLDHNLRTPKYVAVFNLALVDLLGSSALVPKVLDVSLFNHNVISYNNCLTFFFFSFTLLSMQTLNLVALSYDRLVAIAFPLQYHVKVTHRFMFSLIASFWIFVVFAILVAVGFLTRLSFCDSLVINSYFCDHGPIYRLACNDNFPNDFISQLFPVIFVWLPVLLIVSSYLCIGYMLSKITTVQDRAKAFKTCTAHLSLVAVYFIPILTIFTLASKIDPNVRIVNWSLASIFPPMLNPIIYVLQTQEIRGSLRKLLKMRR